MALEFQSKQEEYNVLERVTCAVIIRDEEKEMREYGTGVLVIDENKVFVITAKHVIENSSEKQIEILLLNTKISNITDIFLHPSLDIAVLRLDSKLIELTDIPKIGLKNIKSITNKCFIRGFPLVHQSTGFPSTARTISAIFEENGIVKATPLDTPYEGHQYNSRGLSGSGLFTFTEDGVVLIGIVTQADQVNAYIIQNLYPLSEMLEEFHQLKDEWSGRFELMIFGSDGSITEDVSVVLYDSNKNTVAFEKKIQSDRFELLVNIFTESLIIDVTRNSKPKERRIVKFENLFEINKPIKIHLMPLREINGVVKWLGTGKPVGRAIFHVTLANNKSQEVRTEADGSFNLRLPIQEDNYSDESIPYIIRITAENAGKLEQDIPSPSNFPKDYFLVHSCSKTNTHNLLLEKLCGEVELTYVLIPEGKFLFGINKLEVHTNEFYISRYPITNLIYLYFLSQNLKLPRSSYYSVHRKLSRDIEQTYHPITDISLTDTKIFCDWLTELTGAVHRLPTAHEWERAARGDEDDRLYPWGNNKYVVNSVANFYPGKEASSKVSEYEPGVSPFSVWDMLGNVWEWTSTENEKGFYTIKGGSFRTYIKTINDEEAYKQGSRSLDLGFRVVRE